MQKYKKHEALATDSYAIKLLQSFFKKTGSI